MLKTIVHIEILPILQMLPTLHVPPILCHIIIGALCILHKMSILNAMNLTKVYITGIIRVHISFSVPHRERGIISKFTRD